MGLYYLDRELTLPEGLRRFADDGRGRETLEEGYYVVAIRRRGDPGWVFRFPRDHDGLESIVRRLNRRPAT